MEKNELLREKADSKIKSADHMLSISKELFSDERVLLSVALNTLDAVMLSMTAVLEEQRKYKRIQSYGEGIDSKLAMFSRVAKKYKISDDRIKLVKELKEIKEAHDSSSIEFSKKDKLVICQDDFELKTLKKEDLKNYVDKAKLFIQEMRGIKVKND